jgi:hypothetical protein
MRIVRAVIAAATCTALFAPAAATTQAPASDAFTIDVPVQLTTINAHAGPKVRSVTVECAVASGTSVRTMVSGDRPGVRFLSGPQANGSAGSVLGRAFARVPLDATGSYGGPPVPVVVNAIHGSAGNAHSYLCALLFDGAIARNPPPVSSGSGKAVGGSRTYRYVPATFHVVSVGTIQ